MLDCDWSSDVCSSDLGRPAPTSQADPALDCFVETVRDPASGEIRAFTRPYEQIVPGDRYTPTLDGKF
jgi:hypothetical protein